MKEWLTRRLWLPLHEHLCGRETLRYYATLKAADAWDAPCPAEFRLQKLQTMLRLLGLPLRVRLGAARIDQRDYRRRCSAQRVIDPVDVNLGSAVAQQP